MFGKIWNHSQSGISTESMWSIGVFLKKKKKKTPLDQEPESSSFKVLNKLSVAFINSSPT